jgi:hypothetical protein
MPLLVSSMPVDGAVAELTPSVFHGLPQGVECTLGRALEIVPDVIGILDRGVPCVVSHAADLAQRGLGFKGP